MERELPLWPGKQDALPHLAEFGFQDVFQVRDASIENYDPVNSVMNSGVNLRPAASLADYSTVVTKSNSILIQNAEHQLPGSIRGFFDLIEQ